MSPKGFSFIEVLIGCVLSSLSIICLYNLQIKTAQLQDKNKLTHAAQLTRINQHELLLAANDTR